jgi:uncharacterized protein (DUF952 family)
VENNSNLIYHITTVEQWEKAKLVGIFEADSLATEGFIHCSTESQVAGVLERYYQGQKGLVKLTIDREKVERPVIFELAGSINEVFPHIHGALNLNAVIEITPVHG